MSKVINGQRSIPYGNVVFKVSRCLSQQKINRNKMNKINESYRRDNLLIVENSQQMYDGMSNAKNLRNASSWTNIDTIYQVKDKL